MERCVSALERFHASGAGDRATGLLLAEIEAVAGRTVELGLSFADVEDEVLRPVEDFLFRRYGYEVAPRLFAGCLQTFERLHLAAVGCARHATALSVRQGDGASQGLPVRGAIC